MPGNEGAFDARVIAEFDGTGTVDVVEWWTRAELLCELRGVAPEAVLPLRLTGGAFAVWSQLPAEQRSSVDAVKAALFAAFALDEHAAYDAFSSRRLRTGESADVYLADLKRLATLFGGVPERTLACAFVAGLPDEVRQVIRAGSRAEALTLQSVLARTRAILSDDRVAVAAAAAARGSARCRVAAVAEQRTRCEGDHSRSSRGPRRQRERRCWTCGQPGHFAAACQGNSAGNGATAPAPAPEA